jgi:outer membrane protein assembly factor BamB
MCAAVLRSGRTIAIGTVLAVALGIRALAATADDVPSGESAVVQPIDDERFSWLRRPTAWDIRWSQPITAVAPAVVSGLVAWNRDGGVHAVRLADGRPAWRPVPPRDTLLFPRSGAVPRPAAAHAFASPPSATSRVAAVGHLLYAVIDDGPSGPLVVCLDCSATAEGRVLWSAGVPAECAGLEGPPVVDQERCAIVARGSTERGPLEVVAHDPRDGVVLWRRALRTARTSPVRDSLDAVRARPATSASVTELVVAADSKGGVWALDRSGRLAWHMALDEPLRIVGPAGAGVIVEFNADTKPGTLAALSGRDGRLVATGGGGATACGPAVMAGGVILQPLRDPSDDRLSIVSIDPATLRPIGEPLRIAPAAAGPADGLVYLAAAPWTLVVAAPRLLTCLGAAP